MRKKQLRAALLREMASRLDEDKVEFRSDDEFVCHAGDDVFIEFFLAVYSDMTFSVSVSVGSAQVERLSEQFERTPLPVVDSSPRSITFLHTSLGRVTAPFSRSLVTWSAVDEDGALNQPVAARLAAAVETIATMFDQADDVSGILQAVPDLTEWGATEPETMIAYGLSGRFEEGFEKYVDLHLRTYAERVRKHVDLDEIRRIAAPVAEYFGADELLRQLDHELEQVRAWQVAQHDADQRAEEARQQRIARNAERDKHRTIAPLTVKKPLRKPRPRE